VFLFGLCIAGYDGGHAISAACSRWRRCRKCVDTGSVCACSGPGFLGFHIIRVANLGSCIGSMPGMQE
jgi:hypothetical protein